MFELYVTQPGLFLSCMCLSRGSERGLTEMLSF